jgi:hypothetical protein
MINDGRSLYLDYSDRLKQPASWNPLLQVLHEDTAIKIVHPLNQINGPKAYLEQFLLPLQDSLQGLYRRDDIF